MLLFTAVELGVVFVFSVIFAFYLYYRHCFTYWSKRGVPQLTPRFPVGDLGSAAWGKQSVYVRLQTLYNKFKAGGHKFGGIYFLNGPLYFPVHPDLIKRLLASDFDHFVDRGVYINVEKTPLSAHIFSMKGDQWRNVRMKFTPTFTSGKMKRMYNILQTISQNLVDVLEPIADKGEDTDVKELMLRYTTDIIGTTAFGVDCNTLLYPDSEFARMVAMIFKNPPWKLLKLLVQEGLQNPGNIIKIVEDNKIVEHYFSKLIRDTVEYRDKNNVCREDFLNILMELRSTGMEMNEIISQAYLFFTAGFETSSSTISNCIHELAHNQEIQEKLREEIHESMGRDSSSYTYDDVLALPYLDKVVKETLRKYPPVAMLNRMCVKSYKVPDSEAVIEEGTPVIVSVLGLHRDPEYFPEPLEFIPERFNSDQKITPYTYLPFGEGPRNCIGLRFGQMQVKLGLATLLNDFKFFPSPKCPRHLAVDPGTTTIVFNILGGVYVKIVKV